MKRETTYQLEKEDGDFERRIDETLNMISFVFAHCPELAIHPKGFKRPDGTKVEEAHPHNIIFRGDRFTTDIVAAWNAWAKNVLTHGRRAVEKQPEAFREGHLMALARFEEQIEWFDNFFAARV